MKLSNTKAVQVQRNVVVLLYENASLTTLTTFIEVFKLLEFEFESAPPAYKVIVASRRGGPVMTYFDCEINTVCIHDLEDLTIDTMVISGGSGFRNALQDKELIAWISHRAQGARRVCAVSAGSFLAAEAGILDGHRAAIHWIARDDFGARYPRVILERNLLFVRDRKMWTSVGMSSAIDFLLSIVERDFDRKLAYSLSRKLVMFVRRSGSEPQVSVALAAQAPEEDAFDSLHRWILANLTSDLRVEILAERVGMSSRNFTRVYAKLTGLSPARAVEKIRLEAAKTALIETNMRVSAISSRYGFSDEQRLRRAFVRQTGMTPTEFRVRFGENGGESAQVRFYHRSFGSANTSGSSR